MGNRPRITKPSAQHKARTIVRELYSDLIDSLTNNECDLIIKARIDKLGPVFIVHLIQQKRQSAIQYRLDREQQYLQMKKQPH